jgi:leucyl/phenylalanyl-tRNA--protein transferase
MGAVAVARDHFLDELDVALQKPSDLGGWQDFKWEFRDG